MSKRNKPSKHHSQHTTVPAAATAKFQQALALHQHGDVDGAEAAYRAILAAYPRHFESLLFLGHLLLDKGQYGDGFDLVRRALAIDAGHPVAHFDYGRGALELGRHEEALAAFERAIRLLPDYAEAYNNRGIAQQRLGRHEEALASFERALALRADDAGTWNNRGISLQALGRYEEALAAFERAMALGSAGCIVLNNRGISLLKLGRHDEALAAFDKAIDEVPEYFEAHLNRGVALAAGERHSDALLAFGRALQLRDDSAALCNSRGISLLDLGRDAEAVASFDRAIALDPNHFEAWNNRGLALMHLGQRNEALASFDRVIGAQAGDFNTRNNRGIVLNDLNRHDDALDSYRQALALRPEDAVTHLNYALCLLRSGDYVQGGREFEWRWQTAQYASAYRQFEQPLWLGDAPLHGKTILLHAEQGLGDTLQFARYAKRLALLGAKVAMEVQPALQPLLATLDGDVQVVARGEPLPPFDYHCPLLSLILACQTTVDTIPAEVPYLASDAGRRAKWRARLGDTGRLRVGLAWAGSPGFANDRHRSLALASLEPLFGLPIQFVSLQKELRDGDRPMLDAHPGVLHFGEDLQDFADTAALVDLMDVVVSVDTAVAHLAGALGKSLCLLLPANSDWRWLLDRSDTPWYPTARLFRQKRLGDWPAVVAELAEALSGGSEPDRVSA